MFPQTNFSSFLNKFHEDSRRLLRKHSLRIYFKKFYTGCLCSEFPMEYSFEILLSRIPQEIISKIRPQIPSGIIPSFLQILFWQFLQIIINNILRFLWDFLLRLFANVLRVFISGNSFKVSMELLQKLFRKFVKRFLQACLHQFCFSCLLRLQNNQSSFW